MKRGILRYYVLNYNRKTNRVEMFNIFQNYILEEAVIKAIKKYLRHPSEYEYYKDYTFESFTVIKGFDGFKEEISCLIKWQEYGRFEYEIGVTEPCPDEQSTIEKWDCWMQCEPNIECICHEVIKQYKEALIKRGV